MSRDTQEGVVDEGEEEESEIKNIIRKKSRYVEYDTSRVGRSNKNDKDKKGRQHLRKRID